MASVIASAFGPWPCATPFLPPPFPPSGFKQISNQFLASLVLFFTSEGTEHNATAFPSFVANNAHDKPFAATDCAHSPNTFASKPSPRLATRKFSLLEEASPHMTESCSMALAAASAAAFFFSSKYRLFSRTINSLKFSREANGIVFSASSMEPFNKDSCAESSVKSVIFAVASIISMKSLAFWKACLAWPFVAAVMRRIPFAVPTSSMMAKSSASAVLFKCVPPQNSIDRFAHASLDGLDNKSSMAGPTETTLTGSGYTSPNTARKPLIFCASVNATSLVWTDKFSLICELTMSCASWICFAVTGLLWEKSKRNFSSSTTEPFWLTSFPKTSRKAKLTTCVIV